MTVCEQKKADCIFNNKTYCEILSNTHFYRPCPFYKKGAGEVVRDYSFMDFNGIFRNIKGYEGRYLVSEYGEVVSKTSSNANSLHIAVADSGEPYVRLKRPNGKYTTALVANLVADAFVPGDGDKVLRKDGNLLNCERWNLIRIKGRD